MAKNINTRRLSFMDLSSSSKPSDKQAIQENSNESMRYFDQNINHDSIANLKKSLQNLFSPQSSKIEEIKQDQVESLSDQPLCNNNMQQTGDDIGTDVNSGNMQTKPSFY